MSICILGILTQMFQKHLRLNRELLVSSTNLILLHTHPHFSKWKANANSCLSQNRGCSRAFPFPLGAPTPFATFKQSENPPISPPKFFWNIPSSSRLQLISFLPYIPLACFILPAATKGFFYKTNQSRSLFPTNTLKCLPHFLGVKFSSLS